MNENHNPDTNPAVDTEEQTTNTEEQTTDTKKKARPVTRRYTRSGKRRGRYAYAAPLGVLISLLSIVGVVSLVMFGIQSYRDATDTTALKEELYYFLEPVLTYNPEPFEDIATTEQDAFISAAAYRVSLAEQVRMLVESDESCRYAVDDQGRIAVPVAELESAYKALFGFQAPLNHRSLETDNLEYSSTNSCYYIPFQSLSIGYVPVIDTIKQRRDTFTVRVGFVSNTDVKMDAHGNQITPTADMATYVQVYTLIQYSDGSFYISACADE